MHPIRAKLIAGATPQELKVKTALDTIRAEYVFQKEISYVDQVRFVDFYLPEPLALIIEVDGGYHDTEDQKVKDADREDFIKYVYPRAEFFRITNRHVDDLVGKRGLTRFFLDRLTISVEERRMGLLTSGREKRQIKWAEKKLYRIFKDLNYSRKRLFPIAPVVI